MEEEEHRAGRCERRRSIGIRPDASGGDVDVGTGRGPSLEFARLGRSVHRPHGCLPEYGSAGPAGCQYRELDDRDVSDVRAEFPVDLRGRPVHRIPSQLDVHYGVTAALVGETENLGLRRGPDALRLGRSRRQLRTAADSLRRSRSLGARAGRVQGAVERVPCRHCIRVIAHLGSIRQFRPRSPRWLAFPRRAVRSRRTAFLLWSRLCPEPREPSLYPLRRDQ